MRARHPALLGALATLEAARSRRLLRVQAATNSREGELQPPPPGEKALRVAGAASCSTYTF